MTTSSGHEPPLGLDACTRSLKGPRAENQDAALASTDWLILADGVGGGPAGKAAAQLSCGAIHHSLGSADGHPAAQIHGSFAAAGRELAGHVHRHPEDRGLATTTCAAVVSARDASGTIRVVIGWVGDSQAWTYCARSATIAQVGGDPPHPDGVLGGWISDRGSSSPRFNSVELGPRDWLILGTDGLDVIEPGGMERICRALETRSEPSDLANVLLTTASRRGLIDNTTVIVARPRQRRASSPTLPVWFGGGSETDSSTTRPGRVSWAPTSGGGGESSNASGGREPEL